MTENLPSKSLISRNKRLKQLLDNWEGSEAQKECKEYMENKVGAYDHQAIFKDFAKKMREKENDKSSKV